MHDGASGWRRLQDVHSERHHPFHAAAARVCLCGPAHAVAGAIATGTGDAGAALRRAASPIRAAGRANRRCRYRPGAGGLLVQPGHRFLPPVVGGGGGGREAGDSDGCLGASAEWRQAVHFLRAGILGGRGDRVRDAGRVHMAAGVSGSLCGDGNQGMRGWDRRGTAGSARNRLGEKVSGTRHFFGRASASHAFSMLDSPPASSPPFSYVTLFLTTPSAHIDRRPEFTTLDGSRGGGGMCARRVGSSVRHGGRRGAATSADLSAGALLRRLSRLPRAGTRCALSIGGAAVLRAGSRIHHPGVRCATDARLAARRRRVRGGADAAAAQTISGRGGACAASAHALRVRGAHPVAYPLRRPGQGAGEPTVSDLYRCGRGAAGHASRLSGGAGDGRELAGGGATE
eukprot:ctg_1257.g455